MARAPSKKRKGAETSSIGRYVSILHRYWQIYVDRKLASLGIGAGQLPILIYLFHGDGVTQAQIVHHLRADKSSTARTIRKLVDEGFVQRLPNPDDGRAYFIRLTAKARATRDQLRAILRSWTVAVSRDFSVAERERLLDMFGRMLLRAEELVHPCFPAGDGNQESGS